MSQQLHIIDNDKCMGDGICVDICPQHCLEIINAKANTRNDRQNECIFCGQCVAVCPTEALTMPDLNESDFSPLPGSSIEYDQLLDFLYARRSIRKFKNKPVEREQIDKIIEAASTAPMGFPPHSTEITMIDKKEELSFLHETIVNDYAKLIKAFKTPVGRGMIRLAAGRDNYHQLKDHILHLAAYANDLYKKDGSDRYMYNAPLLMLFHGDKNALSYEENAHLICSYAMLAAHSLGLGTTIIGLIPPIVEQSKMLRKRYGIPENNKVITSLIIGYPKYRYKKSIRRDLAGVKII